jgi:hypothetical protein
MLGIIAASVVALAVNPVNPATVKICTAPCGARSTVQGAIIIQGLGGPEVYVRKAGGTNPQYMRKSGGDPYNIADCHSYFAKVKMADGSVRVAQMQPAGTLGNCSFAFTGPITTPFDLYIGFGGEKQGWQLGYKHLSQSDTNELERIKLTYREIDVENKVGKTAFSDDWTAPI